MKEGGEMIWLNFYYYFTTGPENKNENNNNKDTRDQNTPIPPEVSEPPAPPAHDQGDGQSENPSENPSENHSENHSENPSEDQPSASASKNDSKEVRKRRSEADHDRDYQAMKKLFQWGESKFHQRTHCLKTNCTCQSLQDVEYVKRHRNREKFNHDWINSCEETDTSCFSYLEGRGFYCSLCAKHKKSKKSEKFVDEPAVRLKEATLELHLKSQPHKDAIQAEMTQR